MSGHARQCVSRIALFRWKGVVFESLWMKTIGQMTIDLDRNGDAQLKVIGISPQESEISPARGPKGEVALLAPVSHKSLDPFISLFLYTN